MQLALASLVRSGSGSVSDTTCWRLGAWVSAVKPSFPDIHLSII